MEDWDFARIIRDFGQAARRCKEGGLDGVELSFQTLHLVPQFWSPSANKRTDEYGGSLDNRMRFSLEVLEEVRRQVGPDFIIGIRMTVDELIADGLDAKEGLEIAIRLAKSGMVDFLNVWAGQARDWRSLSVVMANMAFPVAPFLHLASAVKAIQLRAGETAREGFEISAGGLRIEGKVGKARSRCIADAGRRATEAAAIDLLIAVVDEEDRATGDQELTATVFVHARAGGVGLEEKLSGASIAAGAQDHLPAPLLGA